MRKGRSIPANWRLVRRIRYASLAIDCPLASSASSWPGVIPPICGTTPRVIRPVTFLTSSGFLRVSSRYSNGSAHAHGQQEADRRGQQDRGELVRTLPGASAAQGSLNDIDAVQRAPLGVGQRHGIVGLQGCQFRLQARNLGLRVRYLSGAEHVGQADLALRLISSCVAWMLASSSLSCASINAWRC